MPGMTDYGQISQRTAAWAATEMLAHAEPIIVLGKFGQTKPIPKNVAEGVKFRRPVPFAISTVPLVEGVTPVEQQMSYEDVSCTLLQFGEVCIITDRVADLIEDPVLRDASVLSGEQAAETLEMVLYGVVKAGTNVYYTNGSTRSAVNTVIDLNAVQAAVRALKAQRARAVTQMMSGSTDYETMPIEGGFIAFCHTDVESDIRKITDFTPVAKYGQRKPLCPEELGSVENIRFITSPLLTAWPDAGGTTSTMISTTGTYADVYPVIVIGKEAYGQVPLKGANAITPSVINPGTISKSDPLGQRGFVGWKSYYSAVILNQAWMIRIECAATDL